MPHRSCSLWVAALVLCAFQATRTTYVADLSSFLPAAPTPAQRLLVEQLREGALQHGVDGGVVRARQLGKGPRGHGGHPKRFNASPP